MATLAFAASADALVVAEPKASRQDRKQDKAGDKEFTVHAVEDVLVR